MSERDPLREPAALGGLISHQDGSVVSRTLVKNRAGSLTLFAFAEGEGLSEHTTPHEATVLVLDGTAEVRIGGRTHRVGAGEMLRLPAGVPHALHAPERFKMLLTMLRQPEGG